MRFIYKFFLVLIICFSETTPGNAQIAQHNNVFSVNENGLVTAIGASTDTLIITNDNKLIKVPVTVSDNFRFAIVYTNTIDFPVIQDKTFGDAPFGLSASATSEDPVVFSVVSGPGAIQNGILTMTGPGQITIKASQSGNVYFSAASDVTRTFWVKTRQVANKYVNIIKVNNSWLSDQYYLNSWERQHPVYETNDMQIFMVCIWNIASPKVSLYKFDSTFNPLQSSYNAGGAAWVAYRESFNILNVNITSANSSSYTQAFKQIFEKITTELPAQHYGIKYAGHGVATGGMFEGKISADDTRYLLSYFNGLINAKIDFLDWNTNCNGATFPIISNQYQYAKFILASDILRGGHNFDIDEYFAYEHANNMHRFFTSSSSIRNSLIDMINSERSFWNSPVTRNYMTVDKITQSISIFDTEKFESLKNNTNMCYTSYVGDALQYIQLNYPAQVPAFNEFRFHYISNKDFFTWPINSNGFEIIGVNPLALIMETPRMFCSGEV